VAYCEQTIRTRARAYRTAAPDALIAYGTKAFPNVAVLRLLVEEGLGADVSTLGELRFAQRAGVQGERLVVHGNNKSDAELAAASDAAAAYVVLDSTEELGRARAVGIERMLVRVTPGIEADTHAAVRTGHVTSKFGVAPDDARAIAGEVDGFHVHIGSQLLALEAARETIAWINRFVSELERPPRALDIGGGLGVATQPGETAPSIPDFVGTLLDDLDVDARLVLEPGRSLVGQAGVTLYRVGTVKRAGDRHVRHRRQALRIGRRADRVRRPARAAARRRAGRPCERRVHVEHGLELQRRAAAGRRARRRWGRPSDPAPRDRGRPARARALTAPFRHDFDTAVRAGRP
jgi:diaminopimelate decarboxylase